MNKVLGVELRFKNTEKEIAIAEMLNNLFSWNSTLMPAEYEELSDPMATPISWDNSTSANDIQKSINSISDYSCLLSNPELEETGMKIKQDTYELKISIGLQKWDGSPTECLISLIELFQQNLLPELAMVFDRNSEDAESIFMGIKNFKVQAPLFFIRWDLLINNDLKSLHESAIDTNSINGCGVMISLRENIWKKSTKADRKVASHLDDVIQLDS